MSPLARPHRPVIGRLIKTSAPLSRLPCAGLPRSWPIPAPRRSQAASPVRHPLPLLADPKSIWDLGHLGPFLFFVFFSQSSARFLELFFLLKSPLDNFSEERKPSLFSCRARLPFVCVVFCATIPHRSRLVSRKRTYDSIFRPHRSVRYGGKHLSVLCIPRQSLVPNACWIPLLFFNHHPFLVLLFPLACPLCACDGARNRPATFSFSPSSQAIPPGLPLIPRWRPNSSSGARRYDVPTLPLPQSPALRYARPRLLLPALSFQA